MDALSIAITVTHAHLVDIGWADQPGWRDVTIWRLLSGEGWLVTSLQTSIILDEWKVAA